MDLYLNQEKINLVRNVLNTSITQEETMEMIVPDALPDILRIVSVDAAALVRSKDTDTGRVSVSGIASAVIVYCPEGVGGVRKISADIPFSISAAESEITPGSKVIAHVSIVSAEASVINPRKLSVKAGICAELKCYNDDSVSLCSEVEADDDAGIEFLREKRTICVPVDVREKSFVIADELSLPNSSPEIGELLSSKAALFAEEAKVVGNKVIFRGSTALSLLYNSADEGELHSAELSSEFSQILELENISEDYDFDIVLMLTGAYFESGGMDDNRTVSTELHVVAQCVASERKTIPFISDAYSTKYTLSHQAEELAFENKEQTIKVNSVFRGNMEAIGGVSRVIAVSASTGTAESTIDNKALTMKAPLYVTCIYTDDEGRVMSVSERHEVDASGEALSGCKYAVSAACGRETHAVASGGMLEVRVSVDFTVIETAAAELRPISGISYDEESPLDTSKLPSLMISMAAQGDTLWKLAKKHCSTASLILSANEIDAEEQLTAGQMLIIPKKR